MAKTPTPDAMLTAADWLEVNEGEEGEMDECHAVAKWLREQVDAKALRQVCREKGVPVARVRAALARATGEAK